MAIDEFGHSGNFRCAKHHGVIDVRCAKNNIVFDRSKEKHDVLRDITDVSAQVGWIDLLQIDTIDPDGTLIRFVNAQYQFFESRFSGTDSSDNADPFTLADFKRHIFQGRDALFGIGECHIAEFDIPANDRAVNVIFARRSFNRQLHDIVHTLNGCTCLIVTGDQAGNLSQWSGDATGQHGAGDQAAHGQHVVGNQENADDHDADISQLLEQSGLIDDRRCQ